MLTAKNIKKPDLIDNKDSTPVDYTPEELERIKEITSFFNRAPGQIDIPEEAEPQDDIPQDDNSLPGLTGKEADAIFNGLDESINVPPSGETIQSADLSGLASLETPPIEEPIAGGLDDIAGLETPSIEEPIAGGLDDIAGLETPPIEEPIAGGLDDIAGLETPLAADSAIKTDDTSAESDDVDLTPPTLDDLSPDIALPSDARQKEERPYTPLVTPSQPQGAHFGDDEIQQLREALKSYPIQIRKLAIKTIIEDRLPEKDAKSLIDTIIQQTPPREIQQFLEEKLGIKLGDLIRSQEKVRVVVSDPDYTAEGIKKVSKNIKRIQYAGLAALIILAFGVGLYQFAIKPWLYYKLVADSKEMILSNRITPPLPASLKKAEKLFEKAVQYYPKNEYAYLQLASAYQEVGLYQNAFEKLFGKVSLQKPVRLYGEYISDSKDYWKKTRKVPIINHPVESLGQLQIDKSLWILEKKGAYLLSHYDKEENNAKILMALGRFHSNPVTKFKNSPYRNNLLGIDYFKRILTFEVNTPLFEKDDYMGMALGGIGDVYYQQKDYYKSTGYFEKIVTNQPDNAIGHAGVIKNLLKLYSQQKDPRLVIDYHNKIKYSVQVEDKLPLHTLSSLAAFYIDLPDKDELRINYNISPKDAVNLKVLKERSLELLNILYRSQRKDKYGNTIDGRYFAEGYYQRGRYFRDVVKQTRIAMKQFEYAYQYNTGHFLALNERAEILIGINDYQGAAENLELAIEQLTPDKIDALGNREEDATLLEGDTADIYFNYGKSIYLKTIENLGDTSSWQRIQETGKYTIGLELGEESLIRELDKADAYFDQADSIGMSQSKKRTELKYFQGWSAYVKNNPKKALFYWNSIPPERQYKYRNLELAKSHALYKLGTRNEPRKGKYIQTSLGYLLFLQEYYEKRANNVLEPAENNKVHMQLFTRVAVIENNLGAIYEILGDEEKATKHYWKSVEYSHRVSRENEIARYNLKLSFKRAGLDRKESIPIIMDYIPPKLFESISY